MVRCLFCDHFVVVSRRDSLYKCGLGLRVIWDLMVAMLNPDREVLTPFTHHGCEDYLHNFELFKEAMKHHA